MVGTGGTFLTQQINPTLHHHQHTDSVSKATEIPVSFDEVCGNCSGFGWECMGDRCRQAVKLNDFRRKNWSVEPNHNQ
jgi:hypothetical protein